MDKNKYKKKKFTETVYDSILTNLSVYDSLSGCNEIDDYFNLLEKEKTLISKHVENLIAKIKKEGFTDFSDIKISFNTSYYDDGGYSCASAVDDIILSCDASKLFTEKELAKNEANKKKAAAKRKADRKTKINEELALLEKLKAKYEA